jgi:hypothetical protein
MKTATLHRNTSEAKGGHMILVAVMFLIGTVGLLVCTAMEK